MKELITRYHFNFFQHHINVFLEILVIICEFFMIKHYIFKLENKRFDELKILICAIFANVFSLLIGDLLIYTYNTSHYVNGFILDRLLYF